MTKITQKIIIKKPTKKYLAERKRLMAERARLIAEIDRLAAEIEENTRERIKVIGKTATIKFLKEKFKTDTPNNCLKEIIDKIITKIKKNTI